MTVGCLLSGEQKPLAQRELAHWIAFNKIERDQHEQSMLANQAKANLPRYQRKV
jgi:hypothetical protein